MDSWVLRAGSSDENLVLPGVWRRIVQRLFSAGSIEGLNVVQLAIGHAGLDLTTVTPTLERRRKERIGLRFTDHARSSSWLKNTGRLLRICPGEGPRTGVLLTWEAVNPD